MSTVNLIRWSGVASLLAGVLYILGSFLHPAGEDLAAVSSPNYLLAHLLIWASLILLLFGLIGLYARQVEKTGMFGLVSFVLAFIGTTIAVVLVAPGATLLPLVAATAPDLFAQLTAPPAFVLLLFLVTYGLGFILFSVATMRAGVLPRWAGLLLIIGIVLQMAAEGVPLDKSLLQMIRITAPIVLGLGFAWMGYALWSEKRA